MAWSSHNRSESTFPANCEEDVFEWSPFMTRVWRYVLLIEDCIKHFTACVAHIHKPAFNEEWPYEKKILTQHTKHSIVSVLFTQQ